MGSCLSEAARTINTPCHVLDLGQDGIGEANGPHEVVVRMNKVRCERLEVGHAGIPCQLHIAEAHVPVRSENVL
jgi:hypothetical protein